jgi:Protein of unknown function (DUF2891)
MPDNFSLPDIAAPVFDQAMIVTLAALPLSCIDHPFDTPDHPHNYLWIHDSPRRIVDDYTRTRAFYGCYDWHSAVNSTWVLVALLKQYPQLMLAPIIRQRLNEHLDFSNIAGEIAFFNAATDLAGKNFERPYGFAWLLKLYAELATWDDPDGKTLAANLAPLARQFSEKLTAYFSGLSYPIRVGTHNNTALSLNFVLDYTDAVDDPALNPAIHAAAMLLFSNDSNAPTAYEPCHNDFLSPCLTEAMLMARVLDPAAYLTWLNAFLPAIDSPAFQVYASEIETGHAVRSDSNVDAEDKGGMLGASSHLIGLAFQRAECLLRIASALPPRDTRIPIYQRLASFNAHHALRKIGDAGYFGQHWLATYAVLYMHAAESRK